MAWRWHCPDGIGQNVRRLSVKTLSFVFWSLVVGNAAVFSLIWLEQALAVMNSVPQSRSDQIPIVAAESSRCVVLGPIDHEHAAQALAEGIRRDGGRAIIQDRDILSRPDYVVHVEPSASRDLAMQMVRELRNQAIDGHVISDGGLDNAVTVGVFGLPGPAETRRQRVAELGYDVDVARIERQRTIHLVYSDKPPVERPYGVRLASCRDG